MLTTTRAILRRILLDIISFGVRPNMGIHILNGHFLSRNNNAPKEIFYNQLFNLNKRGIEFINFEDAVELIVSKKIPNNKCLVAFTFDDGFEECYTKIKPVLDSFGIKAGFFINPGFINGNIEYVENFKENVVFTEKPSMSWEQVESLMKEGHIIGAHTIDHVMLKSTDNKLLEYQIGECKNIIEKKLNFACDHFAYPYGRIQHISAEGVDIANKYYKYVFSQDDYTNYFSFNGKVINRRHYECDWPFRHVVYFLKKKK